MPLKLGLDYFQVHWLELVCFSPELLNLVPLSVHRFVYASDPVEYKVYSWFYFSSGKLCLCIRAPDPNNGYISWSQLLFEDCDVMWISWSQHFPSNFLQLSGESGTNDWFECGSCEVINIACHGWLKDSRENMKMVHAKVDSNRRR